jgi:hypothetical protein
MGTVPLSRNNNKIDATSPLYEVFLKDLNINAICRKDKLELHCKYLKFINGRSPYLLTEGYCTQ